MYDLYNIYMIYIIIVYTNNYIIYINLCNGYRVNYHSPPMFGGFCAFFLLQISRSKQSWVLNKRFHSNCLPCLVLVLEDCKNEICTHVRSDKLMHLRTATRTF